MNRVSGMVGRRLRRLLAPLGVLITVISIAGTAFVATPASPASAAACYGRSCMGQDPIALNCTAASSVTNTFTSGTKVATIVNEYSSVCNANWVFAKREP